MEIGLDQALQLDGDGIALAVDGLADGQAHPALADAIFLDIGLLDALEAYADAARQDRVVIIGALWIDAQAVGRGVGDLGIGS